jgi:photosystem II stability/assembly factor-like uncharacterized protein
MTVSSEQLQALTWRNIGPHRGGRSVAVAGHPTQSHVFYMGTTGGGVWQTTNGGITWTNVSDGWFRSASVGAIAVATEDPNVVVVGMGEACIRGNVSFGDGVYRSDDGGRTWRHLGLAATRHIARVRIHPKNPDLIYVAALGHAFGPNPERGVFRSTDGGKRWQQVLAVSPDAGAADLSMDPTNPRRLYAAIWQARRGPWFFHSGGPDSGLYLSEDGGDHWERLGPETGLPAGVWGRTGVAASGARPGRVWAIVEAEAGGLYLSDDYGRHWRLVNDQAEIRSRPWYYHHVFADPGDADTVYAFAEGFYKSIDAGRTFHRLYTPHGDHHDLWIDPTNPRRMIHGADGGASISFDGGLSWTGVFNQPTAEFYHVTTDTRFPYRVYGAQQDNTTLSVPSGSHYPGLGPREWYEVGGAESGYIAVRPDRPDIVYAGSSGGGEGGRITRYDHATKQKRDISIWPEKTAGLAAEDYTIRFQWTSPIVLSPHDPNMLYMCGNRVFRTTDEGEHWEAISPDLTRNDPDKLKPSGGPITRDHTGVEVYCTIFALAESPVTPGLLWAGTDDGLVHLSRNHGADWTNVTPPDMEPWTLVSVIEASPHDAETAYMAATRYKLDDTRPLLWRTRDGGRHWHPITAGLPEDEYTRVIREDPVVPGLLYCGTERGVYLSCDGGDHWIPFQQNLPVVPVHDITVHDTDLVIATHGRSFWILDDLSPVREWAADPTDTAPRLFTPRSTVRWILGRGGRRKSEADHPIITWGGFYQVSVPDNGEAPKYLDAGQNAPPGVLLSYWLPAAPVGPVTLAIRDAEQRLVATLTSDPDADTRHPRLSAVRGMHRVVWNLAAPGAEPVAANPDGWPRFEPTVPPGRYRVTLTVDGSTQDAWFELLPAPGVLANSEEDYRQQYDLLCRIRDVADAVHKGINQIRATCQDLDTWRARAADTPAGQAAVAAIDAFQAELHAIEGLLIQPKAHNQEDDINHKPQLNAQLAHLFEVVASADARPTSQSYRVFAQLEGQARQHLEGLRAALATGIPRVSEHLAAAEIPVIRGA